MRFDGFALFVNGLLSEWLTAREKMKVETVRDNTSRLLHQINKQFFSLGFLKKIFFRTFPLIGCRGLETAAHTLAVPTCLHGVSSVSPSWERSPVFSGSRRSAPNGHKEPFMPESGSIHGC